MGKIATMSPREVGGCLESVFVYIKQMIEIYSVMFMYMYDEERIRKKRI